MGGGGYLYCITIDDVVVLVVTWCLSSFVFGDGDRHDELVELDLGELVAIAIVFVPIIDEINETGYLWGLKRLL